MSQIKNIIFDLGGVIINLDPQKTIEAFNALSNKAFEEIYNQASQSEIFNKLDKGMIAEEDFFLALRKELSYEGANEPLLKAWNAMLLDVPLHRLQILKEASKKYRTFLLSNTCEPHVKAFEAALLQEHGKPDFSEFFEKVYYSCRMNMRKPDPAIFEFVLKENDLIAGETVFIDDSPQHVKGASSCGINAYLLPKEKEVGDLLKELKLL